MLQPCRCLCDYLCICLMKIVNGFWFLCWTLNICSYEETTDENKYLNSFVLLCCFNDNSSLLWISRNHCPENMQVVVGFCLMHLYDPVSKLIVLQFVNMQNRDLYAAACVYMVSCVVCSLLSARVYPYLCRAVRNFVTDHSQSPGLPAKEYYVSFTDVSRRLKYDFANFN